jgi:hypothetical protein
VKNKLPFFFNFQCLIPFTQLQRPFLQVFIFVTERVFENVLSHLYSPLNCEHKPENQYTGKNYVIYFNKCPKNKGVLHIVKLLTPIKGYASFLKKHHQFQFQPYSYGIKKGNLKACPTMQVTQVINTFLNSSLNY